MKVIDWNCRGLGQADSPKVPYIASLVRSNLVDIVFLAETMVFVQSVANKLASLSCSCYVGVDSVGLSGGLFVFWFSLFLVEPILVSPHIILCRIVENQVLKHVLFVYGAPQVADRLTVWRDISDIIASYPNVLLIGDFNQVDSISNKIGGNPDIQGCYDFIQWKLEVGLIDIPFSGPAFTWTNGRTMTDPTFEQLDKAYATSLWLHDRPATSVQHQPILFSDHAAIVLCDSLPASRCKRSYMIESWCLRASEVADIVQSIFRTSIPGSHMFSLSKKLCLLRHRLLAWCVSHKKLWGIDWKALVAEVSQAETVLDSRYNRCLFNSLRMEKIVEAQPAFLFWKQRAKGKWDAFGDEHTRLLFSVVQARKRRNTIIGLQDNAGAWVTDVGGIRTLALDFFKSLYKVNCNSPSEIRSSVSQFPWESLHLPSLSESQRQMLLAPFTVEEIKHAMFSIGDEKSPGLDAFPSAFFKTHWNRVGDQVIKAVQFFFAHGYLLKDWNRTFLVLLPKIDHPELISQFRPIGLCNVVYKCIAKCLSHRLRGVLPSLISEFQNAFVPGRLMSDNCSMVHELISFMNASKAMKRFYAALKLDMNKAYDSVAWDFLARVLQVFGFPLY
ncbi:uncharacterized protein LOC110689389 [Chenopodium quinoa]|uniref:uncharacterized protein LOC110689389 n=1 Tax=Chenopodium quinoa TaxID=63459 RepID=UPI000B794384|nr:uncharacterized protein LOC110689389 [Chenopodium quinoa]